MMKIGPFIIPRGTEIPYELSAESPQRVNIAADGTVVVSPVGWSTKFFKLKFTATHQLAENVLTYVENGVRLSATPFVYIDDYGKTWMVRYWGDSMKIKCIASDLYECTIVLRKEV